MNVEYIEIKNIKIAKPLYDLVDQEIIPDTGISSDKFWTAFGSIVNDLEPDNRLLLNKRSEIQENINSVLKIIETLDVPIPNINIAIRFIETNLDSLRGFGIDWSRTPLSPGEYGIQDSSTTLGISLDNVRSRWLCVLVEAYN